MFWLGSATDFVGWADESCHKLFLFVGSFANIGKILEMQALLCEKLENKGSSAIWVDATMSLCSYPWQAWCSIVEMNCKILLSKFNTWKQGQIERKKGSLSPFDNATDRIFAKNFCDYGVMASRVCQNTQKLTKPWLSQARALLCPKVFVPLDKSFKLWQRYTFVLI